MAAHRQAMRMVHEMIKAHFDWCQPVLPGDKPALVSACDGRQLLPQMDDNYSCR
jgi:hypothetical protein